MLEAPGLVLHPWTIFAGHADWGHALKPGAWTRRISDAGSGNQLGIAGWSLAGGGAFASWFGKRQIDVFETEDASFLLSLRRGFWRVWDVYDAEERHIGTIYRNAFLTSSGETLASLRKSGPDEAGAFVGPDGHNLARFSRREPDSWLLTFVDAFCTNPFARMLLLAAVLSWPPSP